MVSAVYIATCVKNWHSYILVKFDSCQYSVVEEVRPRAGAYRTRSIARRTLQLYIWGFSKRGLMLDLI
jgi:hypothetical protein